MKLIMLQGAPGAGKTTWALAQCARSDETFVRVNKDDIRVRLLGRRKGDHVEAPDVNKDEKAIVLPERDRLIKAALSAGHHVIVDDTNIAPKHEGTLRTFARDFGAEFQIKRFDTDVEECVRRNAARPDGERVPEVVIRTMAKQLAESKPTFARYEVTDGLPIAIICDLDGTAAIVGDRSVYDASRCDEVDFPNQPVQVALWAFRLQNEAITKNLLESATPPVEFIYLSGRDGKYREATQRFLDKHEFPIGQLHMRRAGDARKDWIVKGELFDAHVRGKFNVLFVLDDRNQVVDFWRSIGLIVFQVAPGNF